MDSLERFLEPQERMYARALSEVREGEKRSHWIWFIFPQLRGLGESDAAYIFGLDGIGEARAYLAHPVLSARLLEISQALLCHKDKTAEYIFYDVDSMKVRSCMTLFALVSPKGSVFHQVLDQFFQGKMDNKTLELLRGRGEYPLK